MVVLDGTIVNVALPSIQCWAIAAIEAAIPE